jgi:hypothetical protein
VGEWREADRRNAVGRLRAGSASLLSVSPPPPLVYGKALAVPPILIAIEGIVVK